MNTKLSKLVLGIIIFGLGVAASQAYSNDQYVKMERTKSGTFIITQGQIYTVNELFEGEKQEVAFNSNTRNLK
jgi:hypothetical protein